MQIVIDWDAIRCKIPCIGLSLVVQSVIFHGLFPSIHGPARLNVKKKREIDRAAQICGIPRPLVESAPVLRVSNENMSLPVGGSRNPDAVAFSSACENFVICLNTLNYACAICWRLSTAFRGRETEEDASLGAEKRTICGGSRKDGWGGDGEKERERTRALTVPHRECASRKGAAFLSNVIETTIKYERTTMNVPNNPELFAGSIPRSENEGIASTLPFKGCEDMIKLRDIYRSIRPVSIKFMRLTILRLD